MNYPVEELNYDTSQRLNAHKEALRELALASQEYQERVAAKTKAQERYEAAYTQYLKTRADLEQTIVVKSDTPKEDPIEVALRHSIPRDVDFPSGVRS